MALLLLLALAPQERPPDWECREAARAGLRWLASAQKADGSWEERFKEHSVGVTALALLAFLGADAATDKTVDRGLTYLIERQGKDGGLAPPTQAKFMYDHILGTLALSEAFARTRAEAHKGPLERAVAYLLAARNPGKGWRYSPGCLDTDTSVTSWALLALRSAELSGLAIPNEAFRDGRAWIESVTDGKGRAGYTHKGTGRVFVPGHKVFEDHETLTALAILSQDPAKPAALGLLTRDPPDPKKEKTDYLYWLAGSAAIARSDPKAWAAWKPALKTALLRVQSENGGFLTADDHAASEAGTVYSSAAGVLALELCASSPRHFLLRTK